jgi:TusA-related sulfurtransferase
MTGGRLLPTFFRMIVEEDRFHRLGESFVAAVAACDFERLDALMTDGVQVRLLLPNGLHAPVGAAETVDKVASWYTGADVLELESSSVETVAGRLVLSYRLRLHDEDGWQVIEQHLMGDVAPDGRLEKIDLLCSGFLPVLGPGDASSSTHPFDAGDLGCADGLATEFRRRIGAIPVGDVLVVTARDPAAKEDLPPLARMMGHEVRSIETPGDGRLQITVERRR